MYMKTRIPNYLIVTRTITPPVSAFVYETWVFPLANQVYEEPTIIRYRSEDDAIEGHILTVSRFILERPVSSSGNPIVIGDPAT
jgi:hypothetical protein